ncbi:MAG: hypothetical protein WCJ19_04245 [bacterium]
MPTNFNNNQPPQNPSNPFTPANDMGGTFGIPPEEFENNQNYQAPQQNYQQPVQQQMHQQPIQQSYQAPQQPQEEQEYPQDPRIVDYLIEQVIPARHPEMPADQVVSEKDRLYKILEAGIFETAYSQLQEDQKNELDTLMKYGADIPAIQAFFIEKIPNIQVQLGKYMEEFVKKYLNSEL